MKYHKIGYSVLAWLKDFSKTSRLRSYPSLDKQAVISFGLLSFIRVDAWVSVAAASRTKHDSLVFGGKKPSERGLLKKKMVSSCSRIWALLAVEPVISSMETSQSRDHDDSPIVFDKWIKEYFWCTNCTRSFCWLGIHTSYDVEMGPLEVTGICTMGAYWI